MLTRRRLAMGLALVLICVVVAAGAVASRRLTEPLPDAAVEVVAPSEFVPAPGPAPQIPLPAGGSMAVATVADGVLASLRADVARPIGSVAKTLTALVVLQHRPLTATGEGPSLTMTQQDVDLFRQAVAENGSTVAVSAGERLTERQLLLALLLPSANNIAETLARWVGGSRDNFLAMLNETALSLHMTSTHFADPSGYSSATVSTAADLVRLGEAVVANPVLVQLVSTLAVSLPVGGTVHNLDELLLSEPGWIGIKTGWTPQAGGCLLFAARQELAPATSPVTVVGAVLGQPPLPAADPVHPELGGAMKAAREAVSAVIGGYAAVTAAIPASIRGTAREPWGATAALHVGPGNSATLVLRAGTSLQIRVSTAEVRAPAPAGTDAGTVSALLRGSVVARWTLVLSDGLAAPSWEWRLRYG